MHCSADDRYALVQAFGKQGGKNSMKIVLAKDLARKLVVIIQQKTDQQQVVPMSGENSLQVTQGFCEELLDPGKHISKVAVRMFNHCKIFINDYWKMFRSAGKRQVQAGAGMLQSGMHPLLI